MPYIKPYTYVDGTSLDAPNQLSNEEKAKVYTNQEIVTGDYSVGTFDYDEIEAGEFNSVTSNHKFCTGFIGGKNIDTQENNRAYFTSNVKNNNETGTSVSWSDIYNAGEQITIVENSAKVLITFESNFVGEDNDTAAGGGAVTNGKWDNKVLLRHTDYSQVPNITTFIEGTRCWGFEGLGTSAGTVDPNAGGKAASRRQLMFSYVMSLGRGTHDLQICVNPKIQHGFISTRNFLVEVFYL